MRIGYFAQGVLLFLLARPTRLAPFFGLMGYMVVVNGLLGCGCTQRLTKEPRVTPSSYSRIIIHVVCAYVVLTIGIEGQQRSACPKCHSLL
jgi:hypothetical protein